MEGRALRAIAIPRLYLLGVAELRFPSWGHAEQIKTAGNEGNKVF